MELDLLNTSDPRWRDALTILAHDAYHTPEYAEFAARHEGGTAGALFARDSTGVILAPIVTRRLPEELGFSSGWTDAVSPYGYAAPLTTIWTALDDGKRLFGALRDVALNSDLIAGFFRFHPLLPMSGDLLGSFGTLTHRGQTIAIELDRSREELVRNIRPGFRYDVRRLLAAGFVIEEAGWDRLGEFVQVYQATMQRVGADSQYLFSYAYFDELRQSLGDAARFLLCLGPDGTVAAAALFSEYRGIVQYLFSGTAERFLTHGPSKLLLQHAIFWAQERGNRVLHLGGGVGGRADSLFNFKAGFGPGRADFYTWNTVWNEDRFALLNQRWSSLAAADLSTSYFPPYRAPLLARPSPSSRL